MSKQLSPAQALPIDVIRSIIEWITLEKTSLFHDSNFKISCLKEVLTVCSAWRQVALGFLWRVLDFTIEGTKNNVYLNYPDWVKTDDIPNYALNLVKEIRITVPMRDIVRGVAHKLLVEYIGDMTLFPSVHKLTVEISDDAKPPVASNDITIANSLAFATLLKSMAPEAKTIDVSCDGFYCLSCHLDDSRREMGEEILATLFDVLYSNTSHAYLKLFKVDIRNTSTIDFIPPLTQLDLDYSESSNVYRNLMHKSASTLQYLQIPIDTANMFLFDDKGETVIYSNLQYLKFGSFIKDDSDAQLTASSATPFPVLRTLNNPYSFLEDLPFRGNSATLTTLDICLHNDYVAMLSRKRVFENNNRVLRNVSIEGLDVNRDTSVDSGVDMVKFLNDIVGSATRLTVPNYYLAMDCLAAAQHGPGFLNITLFTAGLYTLSLFEVLGFLKALPTLVSLEVAFGGLGPELDHLSADKLPDHVASTYHEAGMNLQVWNMPSYSKSYRKHYVDYILLLALASPNLCRLEVFDIFAEYYHASVARALTSGPYSKYALRLKRLLNIAYDRYSGKRYR